MTTRGASLHATPRACGGFASRHALTATRVPALVPRARTRPAADTTTRASTAWTLDGPGCAGARSGSTLVGYGRLPSGKNNVVPAHARTPPRRCPLRPVAISDLCESHRGRFKMLDAVFEQDGDKLYVRHADRTRHEDRSGMGDAVGRNLPHATARWAAERAEGEARTPLVRAFAAFAFSFRLVSRARSALEDFLEDFLDGSGWARASISRVVVRERAARTDAVAKEHVGVRDRTEVRFVKGVPRFSKIASKIERDERDERDDEKKRGDENRRRGVLVTVDGRPVRGRAALRPGAILQIGGMEYEVLRDVRAHA